MKSKWLCCLSAVFLLIGVCRPVRSADTPSPAGAAVRGMLIEPSSTGVPLGNARLSIELLGHVPGKDGLSAAYKVDISPFSSKSEAGRFSVAISDADFRRLAGGETLYFSGQAVSQDGSNTSHVEGRATPASADNETGALRIQVEGQKGKLVFHTTYRLTR